MKIRRLKVLSDFRGLPAGYEVRFSDTHANSDSGINPICFVGLNGSGKSNVLEAIAEIFYYLETYHKATKDEARTFNTEFGFEIEYCISKKTYALGNFSESDPNEYWDVLNEYWAESKNDPIFQIIKPKNDCPEISAIFPNKRLVLENKNHNRNFAVLPARIIGYSSGMNELLSNPFIKIDFQYYDDFKEKTFETADASLDMNRMYFLNYDSNKLITICDFLFDADDYDMSKYKKGTKATDFGGINLLSLKKELKIKDLKSFSICLKLRTSIEKNEDLPPELNRAIRDLINCATFCNKNKSLEEDNELWEYELKYWVNKETKKAFRQYFGRADDLFRKLYFLQLLNSELISEDLRKDIVSAKPGKYQNLSDDLPKHEPQKLIFCIKDISFVNKNDVPIYYRKLSDGEHQLLQVFGSFLLMDTDGALFLYDEPETHFNPDWRSKFVQLLNKSIDKERDQEIMLTTHSPYIVSDCRKENVYVFKRTQNGKIRKPQTPEMNTLGASVNLINMKVFDKKETISKISQDGFDKILNNLKKEAISKKKALALLEEYGESIEKNIVWHKISKGK